ncbi:MAG: hypothetical protein CMN02_06465, partial [Roseibacillus sp.]|nr:hypothetical protein [Roseibacillus sp.]
MANIFAILTAVVLAISGFLAFKNQGSNDTEGAGYRGWIVKRQNMENTLAAARDRLKILQDTLAETETTLTERNAENETKTAENATQKEKNEQLKAEVAALEAEGKAKEADADAKEDSIKEFGDVEQVVAELKQLT